MSQNDSAEVKSRRELPSDVSLPNRLCHFSRTVSASFRTEVLDREDPTCQMCGLGPGEIDSATNRRVALHVDCVQGKEYSGTDELSGLRILCSVCREGRKKITIGKPDAFWLLSQVQRAGQDEQMAVYQWLRKKFGDIAGSENGSRNCHLAGRP